MIHRTVPEYDYPIGVCSWYGRLDAEGHSYVDSLHICDDYGGDFRLYIPGVGKHDVPREQTDWNSHMKMAKWRGLRLPTVKEARVIERNLSEINDYILNKTNNQIPFVEIWTCESASTNWAYKFDLLSGELLPVDKSKSLSAYYVY